MMKEYWFYLETYVFIWSNSREILVYNTVSGKGCLYPKAPELNPIVAKMEDKTSLYCITVNEEELKCPVIHDFIFSVRENFCGDLLDKSIHRQKPFVFIPELSVNEEVFSGTATVKRDTVSGIHAEKNLLELTVFLTGMCELDCKDCDCTYKQITWCTKNERILPKETMFDILRQTHYTSISDMKLMGGNVFLYSFWDELVGELKKYSFKKSFYIDFRLLPLTPKQLEIFEHTGFFLNFLVDVSADREQIINGKLPVSKKYGYLFKIRSIEDYEIALSIVDLHQMEAKILPFYDGTNLSFFEDHIFQNLEEIVNTHWKRNEIFAHTVLNTNDFGKFAVLPDGKIYANVNYESVGDANSDDIKVLVNQELKTGKSWLSTRNNIDPCKDCLYRYLCPSISNY